MTGRLSLGPVFFHWDADTLRDFYFRVADEAPVDVVHVGEVVCAKRAPFFAPHVGAVIDRLRAAGKSVVLSTLALISSERERQEVAELCAEADMPVEANDVGALARLAGRPHVVGPFVNVYNEATLRYLAARGATRVCLPAELPATAIPHLAAAAPAVELEAMVFGRLPLAISARCFHARANRLHKDGCQFLCGRDPEGLVVRTLDGEPFLAVNGLQTLSHTCCNLVADLGTLRGLGVAVFRLLPMRADMAAVARVFRDAADGRLAAAEATARLAELVGRMPFANGFLHGRAGRAFASPGGRTP